MNRQIIETTIEQISRLFVPEIALPLGLLPDSKKNTLYKAIYNYVVAKHTLHNTNWGEAELNKVYEEAKQSVIDFFTIDKLYIEKFLKIVFVVISFTYNIYKTTGSKKSFTEFFSSDYDIICLGIEILVLDLVKDINMVIYEDNI